MGWKNIKEHFSIAHIVHCRNGKILIGSPYINDLIIINSETGEIEKNNLDSKNLGYPQLANEDPETIVRLIREEDKFSASLPVFTFDGEKVVEKQCEKYGWPNVTHDGELLYDNTSFPEKHLALKYAISDTYYRIENSKERFVDLKEKMAVAKNRLKEANNLYTKLISELQEIEIKS